MLTSAAKSKVLSIGSAKGELRARSAVKPKCFKLLPNKVPLIRNAKGELSTSVLPSIQGAIDWKCCGRVNNHKCFQSAEASSIQCSLGELGTSRHKCCRQLELPKELELPKGSKEQVLPIKSVINRKCQRGVRDECNQLEVPKRS